MPPHVYLIGCWDGTRDQFVKFLARGPEDEAEIFEAFIDYVGDDVEAARLYHWTDYEVWQMKAVMRRWPALDGRLTRLMGSCVDLKRCIQDAVYLPVPRFSIKSVAPALGFNWRQQGFGAYEALLCYWDSIDTGDRALAEKAVRYNEDDCSGHVARGPEADRRQVKGQCSVTRGRRFGATTGAGGFETRPYNSHAWPQPQEPAPQDPARITGTPGGTVLVWCLINTLMKMRGHFGRRQGAMTCRGLDCDERDTRPVWHSSGPRERKTPRRSHCWERFRKNPPV